MAKRSHQSPKGWLNSMSLYSQLTETIQGCHCYREGLTHRICSAQVWSLHRSNRRWTFFLHRLLLDPAGHSLGSREMATSASQRCGRVRGSVCTGHSFTELGAESRKTPQQEQVGVGRTGLGWKPGCFRLQEPLHAPQTLHLS